MKNQFKLKIDNISHLMQVDYNWPKTGSTLRTHQINKILWASK